MLTKEQRIIKYLNMFDTVVEKTFKVFTKGNPIPDFMCWHEHQQAVNYALDLARKGLLKEAYNRALHGVL